ncbi:chorismate synthase [Marvinbryantia formatexigens DSM 14469]|uniref:Chorismate synthase n=1 Tax=Marvinbryantia formatexigens DSM 14469 TaxID=478749 RepID=C6LCU3_9FIRM|nr:chorismate synthase [Marvinbryantia formatexigens]EET61757.1 chorismate synthase [Marvinbryantia formatexigens DSM 14469]UWO24433.1 chorismate synthase [Marvinbryantia formatexigens DSM 14469]SDF07444.1 chorismate synthase [Marvinbryantia formatexigens]
MAGSTYGRLFQISTWGESHGRALGVVVDGCPAGLALCEDDIQKFLDRRKPGQNAFSTPRREEDSVEILSGVFEGKTTGCPISMLVYNQTQRSADYREIANYYRPGHADYTFDKKYGFRDYRGGGRSSGRETIGRVAAGAVACKILASLGISFTSYVRSIGPVEIDPARFCEAEISRNPLNMPDAAAAEQAAEYLSKCKANGDSAGGVVECIVRHLPAGLGDPVFEKLSANLAKAICSIGAVKSFEIGDGFSASRARGSENNDGFVCREPGSIQKLTNHSGGTLGGISDGSELLLRAGFKPTPSISVPQQTVSRSGEPLTVRVKGRHDPLIAARAVVVVESMAAITIVDALFANMYARMDAITDFYK